MIWPALFQYMLPWRWLQGLQHPSPWVTTPGREWRWPNSRWRTSTATSLYSTRRGKPGAASASSHPSAAFLLFVQGHFNPQGWDSSRKFFLYVVARSECLEGTGCPVNVPITEWSRSSTSGVFVPFTSSSVPLWELLCAGCYFAVHVRFLLLCEVGELWFFCMCPRKWTLQSCWGVGISFGVRQWLVVSVPVLYRGAHAKTPKPCRRESVGDGKQDWEVFGVMGWGKEAESWCGNKGQERNKGLMMEGLRGSLVGRNVIPVYKFCLVVLPDIPCMEYGVVINTQLLPAVPSSVCEVVKCHLN